MNLMELPNSTMLLINSTVVGLILAILLFITFFDNDRFGH